VYRVCQMPDSDGSSRTDSGDNVRLRKVREAFKGDPDATVALAGAERADAAARLSLPRQQYRARLCRDGRRTRRAVSATDADVATNPRAVARQSMREYRPAGYGIMASSVPTAPMASASSTSAASVTARSCVMYPRGQYGRNAGRSRSTNGLIGEILRPSLNPNSHSSGITSKPGFAWQAATCFWNSALKSGSRTAARNFLHAARNSFIKSSMYNRWSHDCGLRTRV
jgi:hypothetical protein